VRIAKGPSAKDAPAGGAMQRPSGADELSRTTDAANDCGDTPRRIQHRWRPDEPSHYPDVCPSFLKLNPCADRSRQAWWPPESTRSISGVQICAGRSRVISSRD
jgi:hypothetical protein